MIFCFAQDSEAVLEHLVTRGEAGRALALLRRPGVPQELSYKFAPALVAAAPAEAVDAWMAAQPALNPRHAHDHTILEQGCPVQRPVLLMSVAINLRLLWFIMLQRLSLQYEQVVVRRC